MENKKQLLNFELKNVLPRTLLSIFFIYSCLPISGIILKERGEIRVGLWQVLQWGTGGTLLSIFLFVIFYKFHRYQKIQKFLSVFYSKKESLLRITLLLLWIFIVTNLISLFVFEHIPHVEDSIAQFFQAKTFATGKLFTIPPKHKEFFDQWFIINANGRWYSMYQPVHSLILCLGILINMPWIINPLLGAISALLLYLIAKEVYDIKTAGISLFLLSFSPFFIFMHSEFMNHASTLMFLLLFILFFIKMEKANNILFPLLSGFFLGCAINIRTLTSFCIALPFCIYMLSWFYKKREKAWAKSFLFITGALPQLFLLVGYNYLTNGNPFKFGYSVYMKGGKMLGFGSTIRGGYYSIADAFANNAKYLNLINDCLFEWPIPSLTFVFVFFFLKFRKIKWDYIFLFSSISLLGGYFFYHKVALCFGPRYLYCSMPFLIFLSARGIVALIDYLSNKKITEPNAAEAGLGFVLILCILFMAIFSAPGLINLYSRSFWGVDDKIGQAVRKAEIHNAIIFVMTNKVDQVRTLLHSYGFSYTETEILLKEILYTKIDETIREAETRFSNPEEIKSLLKDSFKRISNEIKLDKNIIAEINETRGYKGYNYSSGFLHNFSDLQSDIIFVRSFAERNKILIGEYPGRNIYLFAPKKEAFYLYMREYELIKVNPDKKQE